MSERSLVQVPSGDTLAFGLLMESAQAHQKLAEAHLQKLRAHTEDLDGVVRDEIRRTLSDELRSVGAETERAARALRGLERTANLRGLVFNIGTALLCAALPSAIAYYAMPSQRDLAELRGRRDALAASVVELERRGGKAEWRSCGAAARLCVRIDRAAPVFGAQGDYCIVKGY